jgi:FKBP-type peptidyl-prolyl cis-trans isomerase FkpA
MKNFIKYNTLFLLFNIVCFEAFCQKKLPNGTYKIPDSIKATAFYAEIKIVEAARNTTRATGIFANDASISPGFKQEKKLIQFSIFNKPRKDVAFGKNVYQNNWGNAWNYDWKYNETYPLLIITASDSALKITLYSGYIYLPKEKKWKLISTCIYNDTNAIKYLGTINNKKSGAFYTNRWLQRSNGTWKALDSQTNTPPVLRPMPNIDSVAQQQMEEELLRSKLPKDSVAYEEGMFYQTLKEGTGRLVKVTDTLTVHYRGSLFSDGSVFDETKDKPATFPLQRLIQGWQIGLVHCKVGGKMRLFIPSGSAYGIRTRSAEIPPNSILVFDVEVLDAKEKIAK